MNLTQTSPFSKKLLNFYNLLTSDLSSSTAYRAPEVYYIHGLWSMLLQRASTRMFSALLLATGSGRCSPNPLCLRTMALCGYTVRNNHIKGFVETKQFWNSLIWTMI